MKEISAGKVQDLPSGQMKSIKVNDDHDVLICHTGQTIYALGAKCPHYGAPLVDGLLSGNRIICPWHHACYHASSGDLLEPPSLDALSTFDVHIEENEIVVTIPDELEGSRIPAMAAFDFRADARTFAIIGAGAAGNMAAQTLREIGFKGRIVLIGYEQRAPYDRPNLSKNYLQGDADPAWMPLRPKEFYDDHGIELMLNRRVTSVDVASKAVSFEDGDTLMYDKVLLATGGTPRSLDVPGNTKSNIFLLRSFADCDSIIAACSHASRAVVIGGGFIGMETAYSLRQRKLDVTVVLKDTMPFERILGKQIGLVVQKAHESKGVRFKVAASVTAFEGDAHLERVVLDGGEELDADIAIIGIGVTPATDFLKGLPLEKDKSVKVDKYFSAGNDVYAAGDIATFPDPQTGKHIRIEHWRAAEQHGRRAAHAMAGKELLYDNIPFFWTAQAGLQLNYVGHASEWDEIIFQGDIESQEFIAFYSKGGRILAAAGNNKDKEMDAVEELMRRGVMPPADQFRSKSPDLVSLVQRQ